MLTLKKSDINQIEKVFSKMSSSEDFALVAKLYKAQQKWNQEKAKSSFFVGQEVQFTSSRTGETLTGTLVKKNPTYQHVRTESGTWKVPASMLSAA
jgi:hypothetical protein